jgi:hypothetical protein
MLALLSTGVLFCPLALQLILSAVSRAPFSLGNFALSCILVAAAALWINADRRAAAV